MEIEEKGKQHDDCSCGILDSATTQMHVKLINNFSSDEDSLGYPKTGA